MNLRNFVRHAYFTRFFIGCIFLIISFAGAENYYPILAFWSAIILNSVYEDWRNK